MLSDNRLVRLLRHLADRLGADGCANGGVREHGYSPSGLAQGAVKIPLRLIRGNAQGRQSRLGINFRRVRDSRGSAIDGLAVTLDVIQDVDRRPINWTIQIAIASELWPAAPMSTNALIRTTGSTPT